MFAAIARLVSRRPRTVIAAWAVAVVAMLAVALGGVGDGGLFERSSTGLPTVRGAESTEVLDYYVAHANDEASELLFIEVQGAGASSDDPPLADAVAELAVSLAATDGVRYVAYPQGIVPGARPAGVADTVVPPQALVATDGSAFLIVVAYEPRGEHSWAPDHERALATAREALAGLLPVDAEVKAYSDAVMIRDFTEQIERDLVSGEALALPIALLVMVFVFGGFLAASAPLAGAFASIAGGFAVLFAFSYPIELDQSAINVVTVLAIGLSIDYGLLIVSRMREELMARGDDAGHDVRAEALEATLTTAGRTVFFSAVTVAISVGGMLVFTAELIRGVGGAALGAVTMALATALTLVPAIAFLFGHRIARPSVLDRVPVLRGIVRRTADVRSEEGAFARLSTAVQRAPWLVVAGVTAVLLVLASPLLNVAVRNSDYELLPSSNERRQVLETFDARYPALAQPQVRILADTTSAELDAWLASSVAQVEGVEVIVPAEAMGDKAAAGLFTAFPDQASDEATALVAELRSLDAPFEVRFGGQAGIQLDFVASLAEGAPWAVALVIVATFVLLFLMTGSLLVPFKTLIINGLSLAAAVGVVSWIFVDGNLEGPLGFTSTGGIETYVLVMIIAFGFGLSMDYEVFLLARIKEYVDAGVENDEAVRRGLQRSGRIISSAAAVIIIVFLGFASGQLLVIKEVGIGLAVAVFLDASLVRMLLVPATMTLLGRWNWWAPGPLRRVYERLGIEH